MSEVSTITEKVHNAERAENKLMNLKAKKNST